MKLTKESKVAGPGKIPKEVLKLLKRPLKSNGIYNTGEITKRMKNLFEEVRR